MARGSTSNDAHGRRVTVVGAGNTGSYALPLLARDATIRRITVVDHDSYDAANIAAQDIRRDDAQLPKAIAAARRLAAIRGPASLSVRPIVARVEHVPMGLLRADVLVGCVDSRAARRTLNRIAWRLGMPYVDCGVNADELMARVNVYVPGPGAACLECAWSDQDYRLIEQQYDCMGRARLAPPTGASASLGALAASLAVIEIRKLLDGRTEQCAIGQRITFCAAWHRHLLTRMTRNPQCAFDHATWSTRPVRGVRTLRDLAGALAPAIGRHGGGLRIGIEESSWSRRLRCEKCGATRAVTRPVGRLDANQTNCAKCGGEQASVGYEMTEMLALDELNDRLLVSPIRTIGLRDGDVLTCRRGAREVHCEIHCDRAKPGSPRRVALPRRSRAAAIAPGRDRARS